MLLRWQMSCKKNSDLVRVERITCVLGIRSPEKGMKKALNFKTLNTKLLNLTARWMSLLFLIPWIEHLHILICLTSFIKSGLTVIHGFPVECYRAPKGFGCGTLDRTLRSLDALEIYVIPRTLNHDFVKAGVIWCYLLFIYLMCLQGWVLQVT